MTVTLRVRCAMVVREFYPSGKTNDRAVGLAGHRAAGDGPLGVFGILRRGALTILLSLILFIGLAAAYLALTPARYLSSAVLLIDPRLGQSVGADPNQANVVADNSVIDSQVKLLTSQTVLDRVATMTNLGDDPEFNGSRRSLLQRILNPTPALTGKVDLRALEDAITIKRPERTYVVEIGVLARDAQKAADIANAVTKAYIADQVSARLDSASGDNKFVDQRLKTLRDAIKVADTEIEAYKTANNVVTTTGLRSNEQQITDLTKSLGESRAKLSDAAARDAETRRLARAGHLDASGDALKSLTIERLRQQQAEIERDAAKLSASLGERHPATRESRGQVAAIKRLIAAELDRLERGTSGDYRVARSTEARLVAQVDRLKGESTKLSGALIPLSQLERRVETLRASYDRFAKVKDMIEQREVDTPPARVIATARPAISPFSPRTVLVAILATAGGLFFGLAAALIQESSRREASRRMIEPVPMGEREPEPPPRPFNSRRYWDDDDGRR